MEKHMVHSLTKAGSLQERIDEMVRRIVSQFHPDKIILFGSHARGEAGPDSDVDLLVVMTVEGPKGGKPPRSMCRCSGSTFRSI